MAGTVSGVYELNAGPALSSLAAMRASARSTQTDFYKLGSTIDKTVSAQSIARAKAYTGVIKQMGDQSAQSNRRMREEFRQTETAVRGNLRRIEGSVDSLIARMHVLGAIDAKPTVELHGTAAALAEIKAIRAELRSLGRESAAIRIRTAVPGLPGGSGGGLGGGGGPGGFRGGGGSGSVAFGSSGLNVMGLGLKGLAAAAAVALPAIQALAGAITALAGSAGAAAVGAGAVGIAGVGALAVGIGTIASVAIPLTKNVSGAATAFKAYHDAQVQASAGSRQHAQMVQQVQQAEQALTNSQIAALRSQQALTQARRDARRELTDLQLAAKGAALGERGAAITLDRARENLIKTQQDPMASLLDRRDAQLQVEQAQLAKTQSKVGLHRAVIDRNRGVARGVSGNPQVIAAQDSLRGARQAVQSATSGLQAAEAQINEGMNSVDSAKRALDRALSKAPKGTMHLINSAKAFGKEWRSQTKGAQGNLIQFAQAGIDTGRKMIPTLSAAAETSTGALRREGSKFLSWLSGPATRTFIGTASKMFSENLTQGRRFFEGLGTAFMNITRAARPFLLEFTRNLGDMATRWGQNTSNIGKTREEIRKLLEHFRAWWHLAQALGRVLGTIFSAGAPSGKGMVEQMTATLNRWDDWMKRNPEKVRAFFARAAHGAGQIAGALINVVGALNTIATALQPILDGFGQLLKLAGPLASALAPIVGGAAGAFGISPVLAGGAALLGLRGRRGGGGVGGPGGGGGGAGGGAAAAASTGLISYLFGKRGAAGPTAAASAASRLRGAYGGAAYGARTAGAGAFGAARAGLGGAATAAGRLGGAGALARLGVGAAAKFALPLMALQAGLAAFTKQGTVGERAQSAAHAVTFGLIPDSQTRADRRAAGQRTAEEHLGRLTPGTDLASLQAREGALERSIRGTHSQDPTLRKFGITGQQTVQQQTQEKAYRAELKLTRDAIKETRRDQNAMLDDRSREKATTFAGEFQEGFARRSKREGPVAAAKDTVNGVLEQMSKMRKTGARALADQSLEWLNSARKHNPKLAGVYDDMRKRVIARYRRMGQEIRVVNGQILDGSRSQWSTIGDAIASAARRGVDRTSTEFARLQKMALAALGLAGYSPSQAKTLMKAVNSGKITFGQTKDASTQAQLLTGGSIGGGKGDGPGVPRGQRSRSSSVGSPQLMGASVGLSGYAREGELYGMHVSSGSRPGAITSSGNVSLHASGDAIDEAGSPANMLRFAKHMASKYGKGLDELIHTPMGFGIKNGQKVPLSFWGAKINADHFDHVHVGDRTPSGGGGGIGSLGGMSIGSGASRKIKALKARRSGLSGVPGALADSYGASYASGLTSAINSAIAATGGGGAGGSTYSGPLNKVFPRHIGPRRGAARLSPDQVVEVAQGSGLPGRAFEQIAHGESDYFPGIQQPDPGDGMVGYGLWQMTPNAWGRDSAAYKHMMSLGGIPQMFNPVKNAEMAKYLYSAAGNKTTPWYGTRYLTGDGPGVPSSGGMPSAPIQDFSIRPRAHIPRFSLPGGGPHVSVQVSFGHVTVRDVKELKREMDKAADHIAKKILRALDEPAVPAEAM